MSRNEFPLNDSVTCPSPTSEIKGSPVEHDPVAEQLRETQQQLEILFESMLEGVIVQDRDERIIRWNQAALKALGLRGEQIADWSPSDPNWRAYREDLIPYSPEELPSSIALRTGVAQRNQVMGIRIANSELTWLSVSAVPLIKPGTQSADQVLVTFRDITEEKYSRLQVELARQQIKERERFLDAILRSLPCLVSYVDRNLIYHYTNQCYEEWFDQPAESFLGRSMTQNLGQAALEVLKPYIERALAGESQRFETHVPYRSGGSRHVQINYIPDTAEGEAPRGFFVVVQDISSLVESRRQIQQKEKELRWIIDSIPAMIAYWGADCRNILANEAHREYFGKGPDEIKGLHFRELAGESAYEARREHFEGVLRGEPQFFEREIVTPGKKSRYTLTTYLPDFEESADGTPAKVRGFFVVASDISRLKELERERIDFELKLTAASKLSALGEMAAGIAHEINNPLMIIQSHAIQLKMLGDRGRLDPAALEHGIGKIESTVARIAAIVRGLKVFAREADDDPMIVTDLGQIIAETLELCRAKLGTHGVALRTNLAEVASIECRPTQISQILMNLISNAFDATEGLPERWIEVSTELADYASPKKRVRLRVTDSGKGIPKEVLRKIMQPFFTTKEVGRGTGLGLSISKGLAETHDGALFYDGSRGNTSFVLELPLKGI